MIFSVFATSAVGLVDLIAKGYGLLTYGYDRVASVDLLCRWVRRSYAGGLGGNG
jgi:hypothetical protein